MKKLLFFLCFVQLSFAQSIEYQTEILTRPTAEPCMIVNDVRAAQNIIANNRLDYLIIDNHGDVNAFYYANGELNVLRPHTSDIFLSVRDDWGRVISYPSLFFDKASYDKPITFRIGICSNCRNSTIGVQYGLLKLKKNETDNTKAVIAGRYMGITRLPNGGLLSNYSRR